MKNAHARKIAKASTAHMAKMHGGKGCCPPSPASPGTAEDTASSTGQPINFASMSQTASYPPRNSGNPGNN